MGVGPGSGEIAGARSALQGAALPPGPWGRCRHAPPPAPTARSVRCESRCRGAQLQLAGRLDDPQQERFAGAAREGPGLRAQRAVPERPHPGTAGGPPPRACARAHLVPSGPWDAWDAWRRLPLCITRSVGGMPGQLIAVGGEHRWGPGLGETGRAPLGHQ